MKRLILAVLLLASSGIAIDLHGAEAPRAIIPAPRAIIPAPRAIVFGSFRNAQNAANWASRLETLLGATIVVTATQRSDATWYRVQSTGDTAPIARRADSQGIQYWRLLDDDSALEPASLPKNPQAPPRNPPPIRLSDEAAGLPRDAAKPSVATRLRVPPQWDLDLGMQSRTFTESGLSGQDRFAPSVSARLEVYRTWDNGRQSFTASQFLRLDAEDSERTHFDIRELFWSRVGDDWDLHVGVKQLFWGVTEFHHLVDIINQTDLVENIDGEDKLGQPMVHLSLVRDWGIVDFFVLPGFRERTFPGEDGRLRLAIPVDTDHATYESSAEQFRTDVAVRWSHHVGPLEFGLYHFAGTNRDPLLVPWLEPSGELVLRPHYGVIDQTGLDAQVIVGDWAWKLEAITRSGMGDRYAAFNVGFERTLVGAFGSRADLGLVVEYMFDERDEEAFTTLFEHDVALGTRWVLNDLADTQALLGVIWDVDTDEYVINLEASRRLGDDWTLLLEGRAFGGADEPNAAALLQLPLDGDNKSASLQRDDYIQIELTRFF
ncbi:MAG: SPOR domain-containing protein [Pseudomonadales bacterium]